MKKRQAHDLKPQIKIPSHDYIISLENSNDSPSRSVVFTEKFLELRIVQFRIKNDRLIQTLTTHSYRVNLDIK